MSETKTDTPAQELRAAAAKLRDHADHATPGQWRVGNGEVIGLGIEQTSRGCFSYDAQIVQVLDEGIREEENYGACELGSTEGDAAWIALVSPAVAEPLAALLDAIADTAETIGADVSGSPALAVARVLNGGAEVTADA